MKIATCRQHPWQKVRQRILHCISCVGSVSASRPGDSISLAFSWLMAMTVTTNASTCFNSLTRSQFYQWFNPPSKMPSPKTECLCCAKVYGMAKKTRLKLIQNATNTQTRLVQKEVVNCFNSPSGIKMKTQECRKRSHVKF